MNKSLLKKNLLKKFIKLIYFVEITLSLNFKQHAL